MQTIVGIRSRYHTTTEEFLVAGARACAIMKDNRQVREMTVANIHGTNNPLTRILEYAGEYVISSR